MSIGTLRRLTSGNARPSMVEGRCNQPVIAGNSEFVHFGLNSVCDCTVNYRLWSGCRTATLYSSGQALRRGAANGTLCCPSVVANSLLDTATSTHGGRSVCWVCGHGIIIKSIEWHFDLNHTGRTTHHRQQSEWQWRKRPHSSAYDDDDVDEDGKGDRGQAKGKARTFNWYYYHECSGRKTFDKLWPVIIKS